ncbi:MAG: ATP-grasp domain-containing protein [Saccharothrix sp.]|nr:ATP-grasp domain-containing protein [Saccharothrix sp.]
MLIVPADPLRPRLPDEHFAPEADAARAAGIEVALVDHDALKRPDEAVRRVPAGEAVYRGWMIAASQYDGFADALARRGTVLRTSAEQYRRAHELPGWYADLTTVTPESAWTQGDERAAFDRARKALGEGPAVLRDYSKSMKHHWDEAAYIPDVADADAAWAIAHKFRELRDDDFAGGFVLRRFERFVSAEVRTWWVDGVCRLIGPHPDTPDSAVPEPDLSEIGPLIAGLGLPFVTADLVLRADGRWRVVEVGDGQVSDRPVAIAPEVLVSALFGGPETTRTAPAR